MTAYWITLGPVSYTHLDVYKRQAAEGMTKTDELIRKQGWLPLLDSAPSVEETERTLNEWAAKLPWPTGPAEKPRW